MVFIDNKKFFLEKYILVAREFLHIMRTYGLEFRFLLKKETNYFYYLMLVSLYI